MITDLITKWHTNNEYHSKSEVSASKLKKIFLKSVFHAINDKFTGSRFTDLGSAIHTLFLEGEKKFNSEFFVLPKLDLRYKKEKEKREKLLEKAGDRIILRDEDMETIIGIEKQFDKHKLAKKYCKGIVELSHYGKFNGIPVRVRPDVIDIDNNWISDIKTCQDNSPVKFRHEIYSRAYHLQACFYSDCLGIPPENFRFIAIETKPPYSVEVYSLNDDQIELGRQAYKKALKDWRYYLITGTAKGYNAAGFNEDGSLIL